MSHMAYAELEMTLFRLMRLARRISPRISSCLYSTDTGLEHITDKIKFAGPVTVADYMRECLLHPSFGYYMQKDVFGQKGDFITSPEVSQVFGELLAVWVLSDWMNSGQPSNCQLVELGPGRGTLLKDMLRVFSHKNLSSILTNGLSLHLVEASPALSTIQERTLQGANVSPPITATDTLSLAIPYKTCTLNSHYGIQASWYQRLQDVPRGHSYFIAHEFFDALPIHQFQRTAKGWREVLVDIDPDKAPEKALRFVLAPGQTPASAAYTSLLPQATYDRGSDGDWCEICPEGLVLAKEFASRVTKDGGVALIADYGEEKIIKNTLRGFKQHSLHNVLESPGGTDITADVDFGAIRRAVFAEGPFPAFHIPHWNIEKLEIGLAIVILLCAGAGCFGPMPQNEFLHRMGIRQRIEALMKEASSSQAQDLISSYKLLTSPEQMGQRFKFLSITSNQQHIPTPFNESNS